MGRYKKPGYWKLQKTKFNFHELIDEIKEDKTKGKRHPLSLPENSVSEKKI